MKANRKFKEEEEAVSAVIGVILMVAITVAIAATVYVYVSGMMGGASEKAPTITFTKDESDNTLIVVQADSGISWGDINMTVSNDNATKEWWYVDAAAASWTAIGIGATVTAGDTIDFENEDIGYGDITIRFSYAPTNALIGTYKLNGAKE